MDPSETASETTESSDAPSLSVLSNLQLDPANREEIEKALQRRKEKADKRESEANNGAAAFGVVPADGAEKKKKTEKQLQKEAQRLEMAAQKKEEKEKRRMLRAEAKEEAKVQAKRLKEAAKAEEKARRDAVKKEEKEKADAKREAEKAQAKAERDAVKKEENEKAEAKREAEKAQAKAEREAVKKEEKEKAEAKREAAKAQAKAERQAAKSEEKEKAEAKREAAKAQAKAERQAAKSEEKEKAEAEKAQLREKKEQEKKEREAARAEQFDEARLSPFLQTLAVMQEMAGDDPAVSGEDGGSGERARFDSLDEVTALVLRRFRCNRHSSVIGKVLRAFATMKGMLAAAGEEEDKAKKGSEAAAVAESSRKIVLQQLVPFVKKLSSWPEVAKDLGGAEVTRIAELSTDLVASRSRAARRGGGAASAITEYGLTSAGVRVGRAINALLRAIRESREEGGGGGDDVRELLAFLPPGGGCDVVISGAPLTPIGERVPAEEEEPSVGERRKQLLAWAASGADDAKAERPRMFAGSELGEEAAEALRAAIRDDPDRYGSGDIRRKSSQKKKKDKREGGEEEEEDEGDDSGEMWLARRVQLLVGVLYRRYRMPDRWATPEQRNTNAACEGRPEMRPYQRFVGEWIKEYGRLLIFEPTGTGKTLSGWSAIRRSLSSAKAVFLLANRSSSIGNVWKGDDYERQMATDPEFSKMAWMLWPSSSPSQAAARAALEADRVPVFALNYHQFALYVSHGMLPMAYTDFLNAKTPDGDSYGKRLGFVTGAGKKGKKAADDGDRKGSTLVGKQPKDTMNEKIVAMLNSSMVMIDEIQNLKVDHPISVLFRKYAEQLQDMRLAVMTATPVKAGVQDLFPIVRMLNPGEAARELKDPAQMTVARIPRLLTGYVHHASAEFDPSVFAQRRVYLVRVTMPLLLRFLQSREHRRIQNNDFVLQRARTAAAGGDAKDDKHKNQPALRAWTYADASASWLGEILSSSSSSGASSGVKGQKVFVLDRASQTLRLGRVSGKPVGLLEATGARKKKGAAAAAAAKKGDDAAPPPPAAIKIPVTFAARAGGERRGGKEEQVPVVDVIPGPDFLLGEESTWAAKHDRGLVVAFDARRALDVGASETCLSRIVDLDDEGDAKLQEVETGLERPERVSLLRLVFVNDGAEKPEARSGKAVRDACRSALRAWRIVNTFPMPTAQWKARLPPSAGGDRREWRQEAACRDADYLTQLTQIETFKELLLDPYAVPLDETEARQLQRSLLAVMPPKSDRCRTVGFGRGAKRREEVVKAIVNGAKEWSASALKRSQLLAMAKTLREAVEQSKPWDGEERFVADLLVGDGLLEAVLKEELAPGAAAAAVADKLSGQKQQQQQGEEAAARGGWLPLVLRNPEVADRVADVFSSLPFARALDVLSNARNAREVAAVVVENEREEKQEEKKAKAPPPNVQLAIVQARAEAIGRGLVPTEIEEALRKAEAEGLPVTTEDKSALRELAALFRRGEFNALPTDDEMAQFADKFVRPILRKITHKRVRNAGRTAWFAALASGLAAALGGKQQPLRSAIAALKKRAETKAVQDAPERLEAIRRAQRALERFQTAEAAASTALPEDAEGQRDVLALLDGLVRAFEPDAAASGASGDGWGKDFAAPLLGALVEDSFFRALLGFGGGGDDDEDNNQERTRPRQMENALTSPESANVREAVAFLEGRAKSKVWGGKGGARFMGGDKARQGLRLLFFGAREAVQKRLTEQADPIAWSEYLTAWTAPWAADVKEDFIQSLKKFPSIWANVAGLGMTDKEKEEAEAAEEEEASGQGGGAEEEDEEELDEADRLDLDFSGDGGNDDLGAFDDEEEEEDADDRAAAASLQKDFTVPVLKEFGLKKIDGFDASVRKAQLIQQIEKAGFSARDVTNWEAEHDDEEEEDDDDDDDVDERDEADWRRYRQRKEQQQLPGDVSSAAGDDGGKEDGAAERGGGEEEMVVAHFRKKRRPLDYSLGDARGREYVGDPDLEDRDDEEEGSGPGASLAACDYRNLSLKLYVVAHTMDELHERRLRGGAEEGGPRVVPGNIVASVELMPTAEVLGRALQMMGWQRLTIVQRGTRSRVVMLDGRPLNASHKLSKLVLSGGDKGDDLREVAEEMDLRKVFVVIGQTGMSVTVRRLLLRLVNQPANKDGALIGGVIWQGLREEFSLKNVTTFLIAELPDTWGDLIQTAGRAWRFCAHKALFSLDRATGERFTRFPPLRIVLFASVLGANGGGVVTLEENSVGEMPWRAEDGTSAIKLSGPDVDPDLKALFPSQQQHWTNAEEHPIVTDEALRLRERVMELSPDGPERWLTVRNPEKRGGASSGAGSISFDTKDVAELWGWWGNLPVVSPTDPVREQAKALGVSSADDGVGGVGAAKASVAAAEKRWAELREKTSEVVRKTLREELEKALDRAGDKATGEARRDALVQAWKKHGVAPLEALVKGWEKDEVKSGKKSEEVVPGDDGGGDGGVTKRRGRAVKSFLRGAREEALSDDATEDVGPLQAKRKPRFSKLTQWTLALARLAEFWSRTFDEARERQRQLDEDAAKDKRSCAPTKIRREIATYLSANRETLASAAEETVGRALRNLEIAKAKLDRFVSAASSSSPDEDEGGGAREKLERAVRERESSLLRALRDLRERSTDPTTLEAYVAQPESTLDQITLRAWKDQRERVEAVDEKLKQIAVDRDIFHAYNSPLAGGAVDVLPVGDDEIVRATEAFLEARNQSATLEELLDHLGERHAAGELTTSAADLVPELVRNAIVARSTAPDPKELLGRAWSPDSADARAPLFVVERAWTDPKLSVRDRAKKLFQARLGLLPRLLEEEGARAVRTFRSKDPACRLRNRWHTRAVGEGQKKKKTAADSETRSVAERDVVYATVGARGAGADNNKEKEKPTEISHKHLHQMAGSDAVRVWYPAKQTIRSLWRGVVPKERAEADAKKRLDEAQELRERIGDRLFDEMFESMRDACARFKTQTAADEDDDEGAKTMAGGGRQGRAPLDEGKVRLLAPAAWRDANGEDAQAPVGDLDAFFGRWVLSVMETQGCPEVMDAVPGLVALAETIADNQKRRDKEQAKSLSSHDAGDHKSESSSETSGDDDARSDDTGGAGDSSKKGGGDKRSKKSSSSFDRERKMREILSRLGVLFRAARADRSLFVRLAERAFGHAMVPQSALLTFATQGNAWNRKGDGRSGKLGGDQVPACACDKAAGDGASRDELFARAREMSEQTGDSLSSSIWRILWSDCGRSCRTPAAVLGMFPTLAQAVRVCAPDDDERATAEGRAEALVQRALALGDEEGKGAGGLAELDDPSVADVAKAVAEAARSFGAPGEDADQLADTIRRIPLAAAFAKAQSFCPDLAPGDVRRAETPAQVFAIAIAKCVRPKTQNKNLRWSHVTAVAPMLRGLGEEVRPGVLAKFAERVASQVGGDVGNTERSVKKLRESLLDDASSTEDSGASKDKDLGRGFAVNRMQDLALIRKRKEAEKDRKQQERAALKEADKERKQQERAALKEAKKERKQQERAALKEAEKERKQQERAARKEAEKESKQQERAALKEAERKRKEEERFAKKKKRTKPERERSGETKVGFLTKKIAKATIRGTWAKRSQLLEAFDRKYPTTATSEKEERQPVLAALAAAAPAPHPPLPKKPDTSKPFRDALGKLRKKFGEELLLEDKVQKAFKFSSVEAAQKALEAEELAEVHGISSNKAKEAREEAKSLPGTPSAEKTATGQEDGSSSTSLTTTADPIDFKALIDKLEEITRKQGGDGPRIGGSRIHDVQ